MSGSHRRVLLVLSLAAACCGQVSGARAAEASPGASASSRAGGESPSGGVDTVAPAAAAVAPMDAAGSATPATTTDAPAATDTPATTGAPVSQAAPDDTGWAGTVELYGFLPWVNGTTTVRGFQADTTLNPSQILSKLESVAAARAAVEYGRIGLLTDISYTQLGAQKSATTERGLFTGSADVTAINGIYDLALRYRFGPREAATGRPGSVTLIPYAGIRLMEAKLGVDAEIRGNGPLGIRLQRQGEVNRTWAQPLLGTQASVFLAPRLRAFARADVSGFGLAGAEDLTGNAQLGLGYAVGNSTVIDVSWRYLGMAYANGASRSTGFTSHQNGIELGLKFFF